MLAARIALAPRRSLDSVPSSSISVRSTKVFNGAQHALAQITALVAIAQLDGFAGARGGAGRHGRAAHGAGFQQHITFHGGVAARIQNLAANDIVDCTHDFTFPER
ncbi:hypothetical protein G6F50_017132 [Rhizopus delemar]|uniref:Uncharacterized protein n=1 Tax=Rhizopus delemar TaxID=936053 RepID=A0A9P6XR21_9FUNG|nr:hypothetical protein G6F50_017132 [Rhizopus delemar]